MMLAVMNAITAVSAVPAPANEPVHDYAPGSAERTRLTEALGASADPGEPTPPPLTSDLQPYCHLWIA